MVVKGKRVGIVGTGAFQMAPALALVAAGQVTVGGVLSVTVKLVVQVPMLPAASVAVTVMGCAPRPIIVPFDEDSPSEIYTPSQHLSLPISPLRTLGTAAWQLAPA